MTRQVDYAATPEEVQKHFQTCGTVNRVTILCDKFTGQPKGYACTPRARMSTPRARMSTVMAHTVSFAYVEFVDRSAVANALLLSDSMLHGRAIKVTAKRTNVPCMLRLCSCLCLCVADLKRLRRAVEDSAVRHAATCVHDDRGVRTTRTELSAQHVQMR